MATGSGYNVVARREQMKSKLVAEFREISSKWDKEQEKLHNASKKSNGQGRRDTVQLLITEISERVAALSAEIGAYQGPHFTQLYRGLREKCTKAQLRLDKIDVEGRDTEKQERKKVLETVNTALRQLASRVHPDGQVCPECEQLQI